MAENTATPQEEAQPSLQELEEKLETLKEEDLQVKEQIAHLQAEISRTQGQGRRRAEISRSSALPALQIQQRRLRAEIFNLEQDLRAAREQEGE
jgi:predicted  nucleic acid-binding Zn-ribbon protein